MILHPISFLEVVIGLIHFQKIKKQELYTGCLLTSFFFIKVYGVVRIGLNKCLLSVIAKVSKYHLLWRFNTPLTLFHMLLKQQGLIRTIPSRFHFLYFSKKTPTLTSVQNNPAILGELFAVVTSYLSVCDQAKERTLCVRGGACALSTRHSEAEQAPKIDVISASHLKPSSVVINQPTGTIRESFALG